MIYTPSSGAPPLTYTFSYVENAVGASAERRQCLRDSRRARSYYNKATARFPSLHSNLWPQLCCVWYQRLIPRGLGMMLCHSPAFTACFANPTAGCEKAATTLATLRASSMTSCSMLHTLFTKPTRSISGAAADEPVNIISMACSARLAETQNLEWGLMHCRTYLVLPQGLCQALCTASPGDGAQFDLREAESSIGRGKNHVALSHATSQRASLVPAKRNLGNNPRTHHEGNFEAATKLIYSVTSEVPCSSRAANSLRTLARRR